MSEEFDSLPATEKAVLEAALDKCRALTDEVEGMLRNGEQPGDRACWQTFTSPLSALPKLSNKYATIRSQVPTSAAFSGEGLKVCKQNFVNEVLGPLVTEFALNLAREDATPIQRGFHGGLLNRV